MKCFVIAQENKVKALNVVGVQGLSTEGLDDIRKAVEETGGNLTEAALLLGISRASIYNKVKKYGI